VVHLVLDDCLAEFSVAITQGELAACHAISGAVGHATSILDALNILLSKESMVATFKV
jgi:hypothetical protein